MLESCIDKSFTPTYHWRIQSSVLPMKALSTKTYGADTVEEAVVQEMVNVKSGWNGLVREESWSSFARASMSQF